MRRVLTILATCAMLVGPAPSQAENPFDFSDWDRKPKADSWQTDTASPSGELTERPSRPPQRPASNIKNYSSELFGGAGGEDQQPTRFSRTETSRNRPNNSLAEGDELPLPPEVKRHITKDDLYVREPDDTLERFNEFLKARKVDTAAYVQDAEASAEPKIQRVSGERDSSSIWDLDPQPEPQPARNEFTESGSSDQRTNPFATETPTRSRFSFLEESAPRSSDNRPRLTDPISTTREVPMSVDVPTSFASQSQEPSARPDVNPFEVQDLPVKREESAPQSEGTRSRTVNTASLGRGPLPELPRDHQSTVQTATHSRVSSHLSRIGQQEAAPAVSAVWKPLGPLNVGQECPCELVVTNEGQSIAERVSIEARLPESVRVAKSDPAPVDEKAFLGWRLENLQPQETRSIKVTIIPTQPGPVDASAQVRYTSSSVQSLTVSEPQLNIVVSGPTEISVGEPATQTVTVRNPGTGVASNVRLEAIIPAGLEHVRGSRLLMDIGSLNPGETRRMRLALAAVAGGPQIIQVHAEADAGLVHNASAEVNVIAPSLKAAIDGPGLRYLGREAVFTLSVMNDGAAATDNVQLMHHIPEGYEFVSSDRGAKYDSSTRMLNWFVGRLSPEQPQQLRVTLLATKAGEFTQAVRATSEHGSYSDAQMQTRVEGTASLVVEVSDLDDPVETGVETAYEIRIMNEGTASANQVGLSCELPSGLVFLKAAGPSQHKADAGGIMFKPIPEVKAGQTITYQVFVKGDVAGDKRFRCRLTSDALSQPLFTEELTKFYGE
ncbi:MAG: hypothetical protein R3B91_15545 [Planctomycetaceae bacterium]